MLPLLLSLFLFLNDGTVLLGQDFTYPVLPESGDSIEAFIPESWHIIESASGDLNENSLTDHAIVLQYVDVIVPENPELDPFNPRILFIIFKDPESSGYRLVEQNNTIIISETPSLMDDPLGSLKIENHELKISFHQIYGIGSWLITVWQISGAAKSVNVGN